MQKGTLYYWIFAEDKIIKVKESISEDENSENSGSIVIIVFRHISRIL